MLYSGSFNRETIETIWAEDEPRYIRFREYKYEELRKNLNLQKRASFSNRNKSLSKVYDWQGPSGNKYKVYLIVFPQKKFDADVIYAITNDQSPLYIRIPNGADVWYHAITGHFWDRYRERCMQTSGMTVSDAIKHYEDHAIFYFSLFRDEDAGRYVYAVRQGLEMVTVELGRDLPIIKTFVSVEMLKTTQIEAFDALDDYFKKLDDAFSPQNTIPLIREKLNELEAAYNEEYQALVRLYARFFEK